jgi:hypothetical protein
MALNFGVLDQGGPSNFFEGYSQGQEKMQANAMAQQKAAQAQQEFGMRQQEFAAGQADKKRAADASRVAQKLASYEEAFLKASSPEAAKGLIKIQFDDPDVGPIRSRFGSLEQALAEVPDDPTAFQGFLNQEAMGIKEFRKQQYRQSQVAGLFGDAPAPAPTNAMAPAGAMPQAAPVANAMAPAAPNVADLVSRRNKALAMGETAIATALNSDIARLSPAAGAQPLAEFSAFLKLPPDQQAEFMRFKKAGAANISATATTSPTGKSLSEPVGKRVETSLVKAEGATSMMDTANSVREALNAGNVIAGPLAGVRTKFAQVLELAGAGDKEKLVNTRSAIQGLAGLTLESRAELRGQGQITDTETKLLEKARSADINDMTIPELQQIVSVSQRLASKLFGSHQTLLNRMKDDPAAKDSMRYYEPTGQMAAPTLEGKTPAVQSKDAKRPSLGSIFGGSPQGGK